VGQQPQPHQTEKKNTAAVAPLTALEHGLSHWPLQLAIFGFFLASAWSIFGPEPSTRVENGVVSLVFGCTFFAGISLWISGTVWSTRIKIGAIFGILVGLAAAGFNSDQQFESSIRILEPPRVVDGRVFHDAIGLSYAIPMGSQADFQPRQTRTLSSPPRSSLISRLRNGDAAILSRFVLASDSPPSGAIPSLILFEVEHRRNRALNRFMRDIRAKEMAIGSYPNLRIVHHAHAKKIAGLDLIEFEFAEERQQFTSRQVNLQAGKFLLNFTFNCSREQDRLQFDLFLQSLRLESPTGIDFWRRKSDM